MCLYSRGKGWSPEKRKPRVLGTTWGFLGLTTQAGKSAQSLSAILCNPPAFVPPGLHVDLAQSGFPARPVVPQAPRAGSSQSATERLDAATGGGWARTHERGPCTLLAVLQAHVIDRPTDGPLMLGNRSFSCYTRLGEAFPAPSLPPSDPYLVEPGFWLFWAIYNR